MDFLILRDIAIKKLAARLARQNQEWGYVVCKPVTQIRIQHPFAVVNGSTPRTKMKTPAQTSQRRNTGVVYMKTLLSGVKTQ